MNGMMGLKVDNKKMIKAKKNINILITTRVNEYNLYFTNQIKYALFKINFITSFQYCILIIFKTKIK